MANLSFTKTFVDGATLPAADLNTIQSDVSNYINNRNSGSVAWDAVKSTSATNVPGVFDNSSGTQNILECKDNGSTVLSVADGGAVAITGTLSVNGSVVSGSGFDGWIGVSDTWTYASSTSFTISGDKTSILSVGDKIKLTQTSVKYFYITSLSYGAPNTTVNITAGSDYSLANAVITSPNYSKTTSPNGFPTYFNYSPTLSEITSVEYARFSLNGKTCTLHLQNIIGPSSTGAGDKTFTLPINSAIHCNYYMVGQYTTSWSVGYIQIGASSNLAYLKYPALTGWSSGGFYWSQAIVYLI